MTQHTEQQVYDYLALGNAGDFVEFEFDTFPGKAKITRVTEQAVRSAPHDRLVDDALRRYERWSGSELFAPSLVLERSAMRSSP